MRLLLKKFQAADVSSLPGIGATMGYVKVSRQVCGRYLGLKGAAISDFGVYPCTKLALGFFGFACALVLEAGYLKTASNFYSH